MIIISNVKRVKFDDHSLMKTDLIIGYLKLQLGTLSYLTKETLVIISLNNLATVL